MSDSTRILYYNLQIVDLALLVGLGTAVASCFASCRFFSYPQLVRSPIFYLLILSSTLNAVFKIIGTYQKYVNPYGSTLWMGNLHILHACFNVMVHLAHHLPHCHRCASRRWTQELPSCPRGLGRVISALLGILDLVHSLPCSQ